jgi:uncharacterized repeat protein (TIGR03803 family)
LAPDGNFYGTTYSSGRGGVGTIFMVRQDGTGADLHDFVLGTEGGNPMAKLLQASDGNFYGVTSVGGPFNFGTLFRFSVPLAPVFQSIERTNGVTVLSWNAVATQTYQIQYLGALGQTNWANLGKPITATGDALSITDPGPGPASRFYRAVLMGQ